MIRKGKAKGQSITVYVEGETAERLRKLAARDGRSVSNLVSRMLARELKRGKQ